MALSISSLRAMKTLHPSSLLDSTLAFFEFFKYETDDLRNEKAIDKNLIIERFFEIAQKTMKEKNSKTTINQIKKDLEHFTQDLDKILVLKNEAETISDIKWEKIIDICDLLRNTEKSNEKKVRWAIFHLFSKGKKNISLKELENNLSDFKISHLEKLVKKIILEEYNTGLDAKLEDSSIIINHNVEDKLVGHYLVDALEEKSRRSPGELEDEILHMIDEGSFSNQELSKILAVDEAMVSRVLNKLRNKNKIVLSSFGDRGSRYYTTNCENCPFGKTIASCRKDALSYLISSFKNDYDIDLSTSDFEQIETNQALLQMKRIFMMAKKESNTKLERNLNENLNKILSKVVARTFELNPNSSVKSQVTNKKSIVKGLPSLYLMGLHAGVSSGMQLTDEIIKQIMGSVKKSERPELKKSITDQIKKFKRNLDLA